MTPSKRTGAVKTKRPSRQMDGAGEPLRPGDGLAGNAEWEAMKASARSLRPEQAVGECAFLSAQYRRMHGMVEIDLKKIVTTLQAKRIPFVLTGAHGIATWTGRPRATHDVDILVKSGRNYARAVKAIQTLYPQLEMRLLAGVAAFFVKGETQSVIDVTYPHRLDIAQTLEKAIWFEDQGMSVRIPALETALANKYGAMLTLSRDPVKRTFDSGDFASMVKHSLDKGQKPIDLKWLAELGELVWPGGGGEEVVRLVEEAKAGKVPNLTPRA
jgi:hypothetical protein